MSERVDLVAISRGKKKIVDMHVQKYTEDELRENRTFCEKCDKDCKEILSTISYLKDCMTQGIPYNNVKENMIWHFFVRSGNNRKDYLYSHDMKKVHTVTSYVVDIL